MKHLALIMFSFVLATAFSQQTPMLTESSMPGIEKISTRHFDYDGLWGYINGGADLYFEYGFESVTVQEMRINGSDFKVDLYRMKSPEAAYGIYSISRFRCLSSNIMNRYDCTTPYQYIAARGEYYLSIANNSGSEHNQEFSRFIAWKYFDLMDAPPLDFPDIFDHPFFEQRWFDLKLISGPLGMQNGFMRWDDLFAGFYNYDTWVMPVNYQEKKFNIGWVKFRDPESQVLFLQRNDIPLVGCGKYVSETESKFHAFPLAEGFLLFEGDLTEQLYVELRQLSGL